jgi:RNA polymerase-binding protein DksA
MARSTTRSLAGKAAAAARKAVSRRSAGSGSARTTKKAVAKTAAPAKKAVAKKAAPAKKAIAKKAAPAKKAVAKKAAPAKKAVAKKAAPAKKAVAKKAPPATRAAPAKKAVAKKAPPAKKAVAKKTAPPAKAPAKRAAKVATPAPTAKKARKGAVNPANLPVLPGERPWTKAEVDEVISDLNDDRARVVRTLAAQEEDLAGLMRDAGDGAGHDQADMGATSFERDQELTLLNNEREKLAQIDRALARIADGTYGICESCGNPIGKGRSMAFPRATLCLTCKQREERR